MITYKGKCSTVIGESWYTEDLDGGQADVVHYFHLVQPPPTGKFVEFTTIWLDLTLPEADLLRAMGKTTRYEIRHGAACGFHQHSWFTDSAGQIGLFADFYDAFAAAKHLEPSDRKWLAHHAAAGTLDLSSISDAQQNPLVWHAYFRDRSHVRLRYSASTPRDAADAELRALTGRANRYLHWLDITRFREAGVTTYDFGGWYPGSSDKALLALRRTAYQEFSLHPSADLERPLLSGGR